MTSSHKHLGAYFLKNCSANEHIVNISEKAWTKINLLKALKFRVSKNLLKNILCIRSSALGIQCKCMGQLLVSIKLLAAVHKEATRIASGGTKRCSVARLLQDLGWEPLQISKNKNKLVTFYNFIHGLAPSYLYDLIPLRLMHLNAHHIHNFISNSNPSAIRAWNYLTSEIK